MTVPGDVILGGVVGSHAYGLANQNSDYDYLYVYAAPTTQFFGLNIPLGKNATVVENDPDATYHEALKFVQLCLKANPTVMELLWLDEYEVMTVLGKGLVHIRTAFLSADRVRDSYLGYARQQFSRMLNGSPSAQSAKHARHLLRLLDQGLSLYETGKLTVKLSNPQKYIDFGEWACRINEEDAPKEEISDLIKDLLMLVEKGFATTETPLPEKPDFEPVEAWLQHLRRFYLTERSGL